MKEERTDAHPSPQWERRINITSGSKQTRPQVLTTAEKADTAWPGSPTALSHTAAQAWMCWREGPSPPQSLCPKPSPQPEHEKDTRQTLREGLSTKLPASPSQNCPNHRKQGKSEKVTAPRSLSSRGSWDRQRTLMEGGDNRINAGVPLRLMHGWPGGVRCQHGGGWVTGTLCPVCGSSVNLKLSKKEKVYLKGNQKK